jgi:hypothetical protein
MPRKQDESQNSGMPLGVRVLLPAVVGWVALSCSVFADADRVQCSATADCTRRGGAFASTVCVDSFCEADPAWSCLEPNRALAGSTQPSATYQVQLTLIDLVTRQPLAGVGAELCRKLDVECTSPLNAASVTSADGNIAFTAPAGFDGYVLFRDAKIVPTLFFFGGPIARSEQLPPVPLPSPMVVTLLTAQTGTPLQSGHGLIVLQTNDCERRSSAGISVSTDDGDGSTRAFYWIGGLPTTGAKMTDQAGFGGLVNAPEGAIAVTGSLADTGRKLTTTGLLVRAGYLTFVRMVPLGS